MSRQGVPMRRRVLFIPRIISIGSLGTERRQLGVVEQVVLT